MAGRDGRGLGPCGVGYYSPRPRFGRRPRYGVGFGRRLGCYDESYPMDESMRKNLIEKEKIILESRLKEINDLLDESQDED